MSEKTANQAAEEAVEQEGIEDEVRIVLEKKPGETIFQRKIDASSAKAAIMGLGILITDFSKAVGLEVTRTLAILTVSLTAPALEQNRGAGKNDGMNWEKAKENLDHFIGEYQKIPEGSLGLFFLIGLKKRYDAGERSKDLYESMMRAE